MKQCTVHSATILGVEAVPVTVEVALTQGIPGISIVGMPDAAIQEARERIKAAILACGFQMPRARTVVNLAPGFIRKSGSGFDLPIAAAMLAASGQVPYQQFSQKILVGELSLDGSCKAVRGMLAYLMCAKGQGKGLICPPCEEDLTSLSGVEVLVAESLLSLRMATYDAPLPVSSIQTSLGGDYGEVGGNRLAKRAMQIAATGSHGILMIGPPGSGKTMLASRLPSILPPLSEREAIESACIHSVVGEQFDQIATKRRPLRSPHHSSSLAGLVGGGNPVRPGEVSLAHNGVLFLDELAEFRPNVLQSLRQPLEQGKVVITRAKGTVEMPSRFMLVAASNPCPCGYLGDEKVECSCTPGQVQAYQGRIGGPLIDRIDICIDVWRSEFEDVVGNGDDIDSATLREGVIRGRAFADKRNKQWVGRRPTSTHDLMEACAMNAETRSFLKTMADSFCLSGRGIARVLSVARTIADIDESPSVEMPHMSEALNLRVRQQAGGMR